MNIMPLNQALKQHKQEEIAKLLGVTQGSIWQSTQTGRNVFIIQNDNVFSAFEIKPAFKTNPDLTGIIDLITTQTTNRGGLNVRGPETHKTPSS